MKAACDGYVVLVDDEEDTRELLRDLLETQGFRVATAEDGAKALSVMETIPGVCLVIVDLLMPVMDGFELLRRLASDPRLASFPVWVSTSAPEKAPPGVPCLPKPVDVGRLLAVVGEHCQPSAQPAPS